MTSLFKTLTPPMISNPAYINEIGRARGVDIREGSLCRDSLVSSLSIANGPVYSVFITSIVGRLVADNYCASFDTRTFRLGS